MLQRVLLCEVACFLISKNGLEVFIFFTYRQTWINLAIFASGLTSEVLFFFSEVFEANYDVELLGKMLEFKIEAFNCSAPCNTSLLDDEELLKEVTEVATTSKFPGKIKA